MVIGIIFLLPVTGRIVHAEDFDPLFAMSEEDCVEGFIKREMQRAGITEEQNLIPEDMLRRKNILNAVLAVLLFVYISLFFFHFPMKTYVIGLIILVVYAFLTSRYQLIKYLKKEIRSRSQEKISNIVMNVKASMVPDYSKKLKWALMAVAVAGSLLLFSKPRIFYEQADDGYYVRFYVYGLTNMTTATIPDTCDRRRSRRKWYSSILGRRRFGLRRLIKWFPKTHAPFSCSGSHRLI